MDGNTELLNFIYQNSQMGVTTIDQLLKIVEEGSFKKYLQKQYQGYLEIHQEAKQVLHQNGHDEKGISSFEKIRTYLMINMQTMTDHSTQHIANMMIVGSSMGIIDAIKNIHQYRYAKEEVTKLMERLLYFEEANFQQLKVFL